MLRGAMQKGSDDDHNRQFGMEGKLFLGITVLIHCYIHALLINTSNMIYIFDVNEGDCARCW